MRWCTRVCICVTKSDQRAGKLICGVMAALDGGSKKNVHMVSMTLKLRLKCGGHEISIGHISGSSQQRIKMFCVLRLVPKWL